MRFDVVGPFPFDPYSSVKQWRKKFWAELEIPDYLNGLDGAFGCYVYCLTKGEKTLPWYIGKTTAQGGFKDEVFQDPKLLRYREVTPKHFKNGAAMLLFPLLQPKLWKISKNRKASERVIDWLEKELISKAFKKNRKLINVCNTQIVKNVSVRGVVGKQPGGPPSNAAKFVRDELFNVKHKT